MIFALLLLLADPSGAYADADGGTIVVAPARRGWTVEKRCEFSNYVGTLQQVGPCVYVEWTPPLRTFGGSNTGEVVVRQATRQRQAIPWVVLGNATIYGQVLRRTTR